jgi:hypothetical protein
MMDYVQQRFNVIFNNYLVCLKYSVYYDYSTDWYVSIFIIWVQIFFVLFILDIWTRMMYLIYHNLSATWYVLIFTIWGQIFSVFYFRYCDNVCELLCALRFEFYLVCFNIYNMRLNIFHFFYFISGDMETIALYHDRWSDICTALLWYNVAWWNLNKIVVWISSSLIGDNSFQMLSSF